MADPITIRVLTDAGLAVEDHAISVIAPGEVGYLGVLKNHAPLVTPLRPGKLTWRTAAGQTKTLLVEEGLMEVSQNRVMVLTQAVKELG